MKNLIKLMAAAAFVAYVPSGEVHAEGATQEALLYEWDGDMLTNPIGKVIWVQPAGKNKVNVTYIIQNALPNTFYSLGFDNYGPNVDLIDDAPTTFGQLNESYHGCWGGGSYEGSACAAVFFASQGVETDADGDASFHINLKNINAQTASIVFWTSVGVGTASPNAATDGFGGSDDIQFLSVEIP